MVKDWVCRGDAGTARTGLCLGRLGMEFGIVVLPDRPELARAYGILISGQW